MIAGNIPQFQWFFKSDYFRLAEIPTYYLQALLPIALDFTTKNLISDIQHGVICWSKNRYWFSFNLCNLFYQIKNQQKYGTFLLSLKKTTKPIKKISS